MIWAGRWRRVMGWREAVAMAAFLIGLFLASVIVVQVVELGGGFGNG